MDDSPKFGGAEDEDLFGNPKNAWDNEDDEDVKDCWDDDDEEVEEVPPTPAVQASPKPTPAQEQVETKIFDEHDELRGELKQKMLHLQEARAVVEGKESSLRSLDEIGGESYGRELGASINILHKSPHYSAMLESVLSCGCSLLKSEKDVRALIKVMNDAAKKKKFDKPGKHKAVVQDKSKVVEVFGLSSTKQEEHQTNDDVDEDIDGDFM